MLCHLPPPLAWSLQGWRPHLPCSALSTVPGTQQELSEEQGREPGLDRRYPGVAKGRGRPLLFSAVPPAWGWGTFLGLGCWESLGGRWQTPKARHPQVPGAEGEFALRQHVIAHGEDRSWSEEEEPGSPG